MPTDHGGPPDGQGAASPDGQGASLGIQGVSPDIQGVSPGIQGVSPDNQGGGLPGGRRGSLAGHGDSPGSRDGWRAPQPGSPGIHGAGGSGKAQAGTGVRAVSGEAGLACTSGSDVGVVFRAYLRRAPRAVPR